MNKEAAFTALKSVGRLMVDATRTQDEAVVSAAQTIAHFVETRTRVGAPLDAGDEDVLPSLHKALGSSLTASRDMHQARLTAFGLAQRLGILGDDVGTACPCGEGPSGEAKVPLTLVAGESMAA
jgi:hypothetical protein